MRIASWDFKRPSDGASWSRTPVSSEAEVWEVALQKFNQGAIVHAIDYGNSEFYSEEKKGDTETIRHYLGSVVVVPS